MTQVVGRIFTTREEGQGRERITYRGDRKGDLRSGFTVLVGSEDGEGMRGQVSQWFSTVEITVSERTQTG